MTWCDLTLIALGYQKQKNPPNPMKQFSSIKWYVGKPLEISISTLLQLFYKMVNILLAFHRLIGLFCYKGIGAVLPKTTWYSCSRKPVRSVDEIILCSDCYILVSNLQKSQAYWPSSSKAYPSFWQAENALKESFSVSLAVVAIYGTK